MELKIKKGVLIDEELGMIGHITNKRAVDELVKRVNEYEKIKNQLAILQEEKARLIKNGNIAIENLSAKCANLEIENQQIKTLNRELADALQELVDIIENSLEGKYKIDSFTTQYARKLLEKAEGVE